jgi:mono/diheme cytochrome c family protein
MMSKTRLFAATFLIFGGSFLLSAQQAPAPASAPAAPAAAGEQPQGRGGGGRGRGGAEQLPGGPQADDPAYANYNWSKKTPVVALAPDKQLEKFILQPGYRLELVLADPIIKEPTAVTFDGNGRMFVIEDRGYMQDADATGELNPVGRVSMHVDTNNDGVYDKHTVFADKLVFPRFATPFGPNTLLIKETHAQEIWKYTDVNGDGVADKRELFDTGYGRTGNVEHQESHFTIGLDNWMYSTYNVFRARWTPGGVVKEPTGAGGGQWGVSQDNDGKMWFQGGASGLPGYWQLPVLYGNFGGGRGGGGAGTPGEAPLMDPDLGTTWGAPVRVADMQGGLSATRMPDGSLRSATGAAGGDIVRAHRMPADLQGDYVYGEVVGRIVRRVRPETRDGATFIRNYYDGNEFIKSTDPLFRPVDQTTAPDGTIYITDMYHGIIQQATWSGPGTYLRKRIEQYELDKVVGTGRIWRLVYDGVKFDRSDALRRDTTMPKMNDETPAQLVRHLAHPNGWWRDTAQQLLVLKQDKSVVPALQARLRSSNNLLEKFHVLWTLEGLGALDVATARQQMESPEPRMRIQAIRASETLYKAGDRSLAEDYKRLARDPSVDVVIQSLLTMNKWKVPEAAAIIKATADTNKARGIQLVATTILAPPAAGGGGGGRGGGAPTYTAEEVSRITRGGQIYAELCYSCHAADGLGEPKSGSTGTMAPALAGSPRVNGHRDYVVKAILHGLRGPVDGRDYTDVMIPMGDNPDEWVAAVSSYVRTNFGNSSGPVTVDDVKRVRAAAGTRSAPWTVADLERSVPKIVVPDPATWKLTASHNAPATNGALSLIGWNTQAAQTAGMWFQVELPQPIMATEVQFVSTAGGGRGGGGRGGAQAGRGGRGAVAPPVAGANAAPPPPPPPPNFGFPRAYTVETSLNGTTWTPVASGQGQGATTIITFAPAQAKFIKLTQTAATDGLPPWSMTQLKILEAGR